MPELPDVEGFRIDLAEHLPGQRVREVQVLDAGVLRNASKPVFRSRLLGSRFGTPQRRGKWLVIPTDGPVILIHNGMTGHPYLVVSPWIDGATAGDEAGAHDGDRLVITAEGVQLRYADLRKLGGVWLVDSDLECAAIIGVQGPDALGISRAELAAALRGRTGALKTVLMNQQVLAGLGNMLSDEICWRARLHPLQAVQTLGSEDLRQLHRAVQMTLESAVRHGRIPRTRSWLSSTRTQPSARCPRCHSLLTRSRISGRTSIWCPQCQPEHVTNRAQVDS